MIWKYREGWKQKGWKQKKKQELEFTLPKKKEVRVVTDQQSIKQMTADGGLEHSRCEFTGWSSICEICIHIPCKPLLYKLIGCVCVCVCLCVCVRACPTAVPCSCRSSSTLRREIVRCETCLGVDKVLKVIIAMTLVQSNSRKMNQFRLSNSMRSGKFFAAASSIACTCVRM